MKKTSKFLLAILITAAFCASLTACSDNSGDDPNVSDGSDMPQISVDTSDEVQTAPEPPVTSDNTTPEESAAPETTPEIIPENTTDPVSEIITAEDTTPPETDRSETALIDETTVPETSPEVAGNTEPLDVSTVTDVSGSAIAQLALAQEGKLFFYGGASPETGFDNSGLIYYVLNQNGISCPRLTNQIAEMDGKITYEELQPGDIVFFEYEGSGKADFGGIYIGDGAMIVSTDEDRPVSKVDITTNYYQRTFQYGIKTGR